MTSQSNFILDNLYTSNSKVDQLKEYIHFLEVKLESEQLKLARDKRIKNLEDNLKTFREEAMRLKSVEKQREE